MIPPSGAEVFLKRTTEELTAHSCFLLLFIRVRSYAAIRRCGFQWNLILINSIETISFQAEFCPIVYVSKYFQDISNKFA